MIKEDMWDQQFHVSNRSVGIWYGAGFEKLDAYLKGQRVIFITDDHIFEKHRLKFQGRDTIVLPAGENHKHQETINTIIDQLITLQADRKSYVVGVGGGVVTDMAGFAASIYMRGVRFGFVPTSVLAMVDASIGGKNGIDVGVYKNLVGVINQPEFLLYDYSFLQTLPHEEWVNGFAEIIKHACIRDPSLFQTLQKASVSHYQNTPDEMAAIITRNVAIKSGIVSRDERESGERKLLNFGHTIGHAIENTSQLPHGHAISIGMVAACRISEVINHLDPAVTASVVKLLQQYQLPVSHPFDKEKTWDILVHDKKKAGDQMSFVVLDAIGAAAIQSISLDQLHQIFNQL